MERIIAPLARLVFADQYIHTQSKDTYLMYDEYDCLTVMCAV